MTETSEDRRPARRGVSAPAVMAALVVMGITTLLIMLLIANLLFLQWNVPITRPLFDPPAEACERPRRVLAGRRRRGRRSGLQVAGARCQSDPVSLGFAEYVLPRSGWLGGFDGYVDLYIDTTELRTRRDVNPWYRYRRLTLEGRIAYENAPDTTFSAVLEWVGDAWKILDLGIYSEHRRLYDGLFAV